MKIRKRMLILLVVTLVSLSLNGILFFVNQAVSSRFVALKLDSVLMSRDIARLRYLSDELDLSREFGKTFDEWTVCREDTGAKIDSLVSDSRLGSIMREKDDIQQIETVKGMWAMATSQLDQIEAAGAVLKERGVPTRIVDELGANVSAEAMQLDSTITFLVAG